MPRHSCEGKYYTSSMSSGEGLAEELAEELIDMLVLDARISLFIPLADTNCHSLGFSILYTKSSIVVPRKLEIYFL